MVYRISPLDPGVDRSEFRCGVQALDRYFHAQATQDIRRRVSTCFVALDEQQRIAGFYTLAATSILLADLPATIARKLPRYSTVPAVRMGRLAVGMKSRGKGLGGAMLADALTRTLDSDIAAFALIVDAKDDDAVSFYQHHGFIAFVDQPRTLFLPLATAKMVRRP